MPPGGTIEQKIKLYLAPMEGVADSGMRQVLTAIGGIDQCTTEFMRVTNHVHSDEIFFRYCPELKNNSKTHSGTTTYVQLLGSDTQNLAGNALRAAELGAAGIDLNFGCPAKTVNRHDGGAALLKSPERIFQIVKAVRQVLPASTPLTAKIRLGFEDRSECLENALAVQEGGAEKITVHCRTKTDGYKPPAYWEWIPRIKEKIQIPIIANGEIWTREDFHRCKEVTGCSEFMIGRGAIMNPYLFFEIKNEHHAIDLESEAYWNLLKNWIPQFYLSSAERMNPAFAVSRTKQWMKYLAEKNPWAKRLFEELKTLHQPEAFYMIIQKAIDQTHNEH